MDNCRLQARDWLSRSTRKEFEAIIQEAKLTPRQMEIIELKFIHDLKNYQIAMRIDTCQCKRSKEICSRRIIQLREH